VPAPAAAARPTRAQECWCKKGPPDNKIFTSQQLQPPLPEDYSRRGSGGGSSGGAGSTSGSPGSSRAGSRPGSGSRGGSGGGGGDAAAAAAPTAGDGYKQQVAALTEAADALGVLLQNHHQVGGEWQGGAVACLPGVMRGALAARVAANRSARDHTHTHTHTHTHNMHAQHARTPASTTGLPAQRAAAARRRLCGAAARAGGARAAGGAARGAGGPVGQQVRARAGSWAPGGVAHAERGARQPRGAVSGHA
jgi:hypothetical protein